MKLKYFNISLTREEGPSLTIGIESEEATTLNVKLALYNGLWLRIQDERNVDIGFMPLTDQVILWLIEVAKRGAISLTIHRYHEKGMDVFNFFERAFEVVGA